MKRVLFVDDEPNILQGLKRSLRGLRREWEMDFAISGADALEMMKSAPYDIVVSDMKMPEMDGADLLSGIKKLHPETIRIILSGHSDSAMVLKSVGASHQYLSKPCNPDLLKETITRAASLRALLQDESIASAVSGMNSLPTLPALFQEVVAELQKPQASLEHVGQIIAHDIGMSAKVLQVVNSAYFGLRQPISSVCRAVTHLGLETINALILGSDAFSHYEDIDLPGFSMDAVWNHSTRTAISARTIARDLDPKASLADEAFLAGMLHDSGRLILAAEMPERYAEALSLIEKDQLTLSEAERRATGVTHGEVGAYVIGSWGLPDSIVEAIAYHEHPGDAPSSGLVALTLVHAAAGLATPGGSVDEGYLEALGLLDRLPSWRDMCEETLDEVVAP